jgi:hypothetical protein
MYQLRQFQDPPKFTQIGIFGVKLYHLATLLFTCYQRNAGFSVSNIEVFVQVQAIEEFC